MPNSSAVNLVSFIISLRDNPNKDGVPGHRFSDDKTAAYIPKLVVNSDSTDPDNQFTYSLNDAIDIDIWMSNLAAAANSGPILIFIHGFDNLAPAVVTRFMAVRAGMVNAGDGITTVCFDWPASNKAEYKDDQMKAKESGSLLVSDCLKAFEARHFNMKNIHILTHSMGGYVLQNAFIHDNQPPQIGQVMMAEADVQKVAFDGVNTPDCVLNCFLEYTENLTVFWSNADVALKTAKVFDGFVGPCGKPTPSKAPDATRLGLEGLTDKSLLSSYADKLSNVGYVDYYNEIYGLSAVKLSSDSHVWPVLGTKNIPQASGDSHFMGDVWEVINSVEKFSYRKLSSPNNWTFKTD